MALSYLGAPKDNDQGRCGGRSTLPSPTMIPVDPGGVRNEMERKIEINKDPV